MPEWTEAGMEIDDRDPPRLAQLLASDGADRAIAPHRLVAAEKHALGMAVLALADGALQAVGAMLLGIGVEGALRRGLARLVPLLRQDGVGQDGVAVVRRVALVVVDEVAVDVDVVLVD